MHFESEIKIGLRFLFLSYSLNYKIAQITQLYELYVEK